MPAVTLPVFSPQFREVINLLHQPANPPTVEDAAKSCVIAFRALEARVSTDHPVTNEDIVRAAQYQSRIMAELGGGEPPWFQAAMRTALQPLKTQLDRFETRLDRFEMRLDGFENKLDDTKNEVRVGRRTVALLWNRKHGITRDAKLEVVPFPDGSDPTKEPHMLPPLTSLAAVDALGRDDKEKYATNYCGDNPLPPAAHFKSQIIQAIGVKRDFY